MDISFRKESVKVAFYRKLYFMLLVWIFVFFFNISIYILYLSFPRNDFNLAIQADEILQVNSAKESLYRFTVLDDKSESNKVDILKCQSSNTEFVIFNSNSDKQSSHFDLKFFETKLPNRTEFDHKQHDEYYMIYSIESEVNSIGGNTWYKADFRMWYNLDLSFPEPVTYFDIRSHLIDLLSPPLVEFNQKTFDAPVVWVISNCYAHNGRQVFMKHLMSKIKVDSFGACLQNKKSHTPERMKNNIALYSKYLFVIAIENSNCVDYVTEKLVHAIASGSIPIVAGRNGKPDYLKFMPKNSFINIYDFKNMSDLVTHLKSIQRNTSEYEKYIYFKRNHSYTSSYLKSLDLKSIIELSKIHFKQFDKEENSNLSGQVFFNELILKEKSENKLCKLGKHFYLILIVKK
jgi:hypothetical protein